VVSFKEECTLTANPRTGSDPSHYNTRTRSTVLGCKDNPDGILPLEWSNALARILSQSVGSAVECWFTKTPVWSIRWVFEREENHLKISLRVALHGYWKGDGLPVHPRIEAGANAWFWGVPLPSGVYNSLVFMDPRDLRAMGGSLRDKFLTMLASSTLLPSGCRAELSGPIRASDATPTSRSTLTSPLAFLGDVELAPLLRCVRGGMTSPELLGSWMTRVPPDKGRAIAHWLMARGLLVPRERGPMSQHLGLA
jgi:hypothetical protein